ncbi:hypothetical protein BF95_25560 [Sphingobium sp. Ant17]|nr:hypothetical protein BF95_25560 [Sphingobium sp. Ant17]
MKRQQMVGTKNDHFIKELIVKGRYNLMQMVIARIRLASDDTGKLDQPPQRRAKITCIFLKSSRAHRTFP